MSMTTRLRLLAKQHRHVWVASAIFVAASFAFSLWGYDILHPSHLPQWFQSGDLWGYFRSAENVSWGWVGGIYEKGTGTVTLPGIIFLLTPVAFVAYHLHLTTGYPFPVPHPTAWLLLSPYILVFVAVPLVALDSLSQALGVSGRRRVYLTIAQAVLIWQLIAWWGHLEDALAIAFLIWAVLSVREGKNVRAGWLLAVAFCFQPLVVLAAPILWSQVPAGQRGPFVLRSVTPPIFLVLLVLATNPKRAWVALFHQLNYPSVDHATPWIYVISPGLRLKQIVHYTRPALLHGHWTQVHLTSVSGPAISAGPMRIIMVLLAGTLGVYLYRKHISLSLHNIVRLIMLAFILRCVLEPVMVSFYLWPYMAMAMLLVMVSGHARRRQLSVLGLLCLQIAFAFEHYGPWPWYLLQCGFMLVVVCLSWPLGRRAPRDRASDERVSAAPSHISASAARSGPE